MIVIVFLLAIGRHFWRRCFQIRETAWATTGSTYCKMCRKNIARIDAGKDDNSKAAAHFYVNSTGDNSPTSTYSDKTTQEKTLKFNRHFNYMKTSSEEQVDKFVKKFTLVMKAKLMENQVC